MAQNKHKVAMPNILLSSNDQKLIYRNQGLAYFINQYINDALFEKDTTSLIKLYTLQKSDEDFVKLLTIVETQIYLLKDQKIKLISITNIIEKKRKSTGFVSKVLVDMNVQTTDYKIRINLEILLQNDNKWLIKENLNITR